MQTASEFLEEFADDAARNIFLVRRPSPRSIREQIELAVKFVHAGMSEGRFAVGHKILIVGGGATAVTAAEVASRLRIRVKLLNPNDRLFGPQSNCSSRFLHPHEYDWPAHHFGETRYPFTQSDRELGASDMSWSANVSSAIAEEWESRLDNYPHIVRDAPASVVPKNGRDLRLFIEREISRVGYSAVIVAAGFEERTVGSYSGPAYWSTDHLTKVDFGYKDPPATLSVLLSGGGDGGIGISTNDMH